jgi:hypothetical protein
MPAITPASSTPARPTPTAPARLSRVFSRLAAALADAETRAWDPGAGARR